MVHQASLAGSLRHGRHDATASAFEVGQALRIRRGLLQGAEGQLFRHEGGHRLVLTVGLRDKAVLVSVAPDDVEAI